MTTWLFLFGCLITISCNSAAGSANSTTTTGITSEPAPTSNGTGKGTITCSSDGKQKTFKVQQGFLK